MRTDDHRARPPSGGVGERRYPRSPTWGQRVLDFIDGWWESLRSQWPGGAPTLSDIVLTGFLLLLAMTFFVQVTADSDAPDILGIVALFVSPLFAVPFLWRRTYPSRVAGVVAGAHVMQLLLLSEGSMVNITAPLAVYSVARWEEDRRLRRFVLVLAAVGSVLAGFDWTGYGLDYGSTPEHLLVVLVIAFFCMAVAVSAWLLGALVRQRAQSVEQTRQRAEAVERGRVQNIRLAAQEERARIAREMHDIVAHSLSVIVVQSDGASYALDMAVEDDDPHAALAAARAASSALATIGQTARESLADTRRLVAVLRQDAGGAEYTPTGGLGSIDELIDPLRAAGLHITTDVTGRPHPLSRAADLAAYRVVQESLTNVIKHAGEASVWVSIDYLDHAVLLTVRDNGVGVLATTDEHGHGLIGMKERITAVGGGLWAGGASGGGFVVEARIPYDESTPRGAHTTAGDGERGSEKETR